MVVKSYAKERYEVRQFVGQNRNLLELNVHQGMLGTRLWTLAEFIGSGCGVAIILWVGGNEVLHGRLSAGGLMAFSTFITGYMYGPILRVIQLNDQIARTNAALNRIFATLDTPPNIQDREDAVGMNADRIVVMDQGRIVDVGPHAELVARPGVYKNLYDEQFKSAQDEAFADLLT